MMKTNTADAPASVPISTLDSTGPSDRMPSGLGTVREMPPGAGSAIRRGCTSTPARASPVRARPAAANGRHRRDGSRPVG